MNGLISPPPVGVLDVPEAQPGEQPDAGPVRRVDVGQQRPRVHAHDLEQRVARVLVAPVLAQDADAHLAPVAQVRRAHQVAAVDHVPVRVRADRMNARWLASVGMALVADALVRLALGQSRHSRSTASGCV
jgi:hypothetical protein